MLVAPKNLVRALVATLLFGMTWGCDKEESEASNSDADANEADAGPQLDPALAEAVASATGDAKPAPVASSSAGPPPRGIFEPGAADREIRRGVPPDVTVGSRGADPKVQLGATLAPGSRAKGSVTISLQSDPRQRPIPIEFDVSVVASKPPATAGKPPREGVVEVTVTVDAARAGAQVSVPPQFAARIGKLKGHRVSYRVLPGGGGQGFSPTLPKGAAEEQEQWLRALSDTFSTLTLAYPSEPMGAGGFWMVTSRDGVMGLDLVTYRMVRVQRVDQNGAVLELSTKRYAAGTEFDLAGLAGQYQLEELSSTADGTLMLRRSQPLPHKGRLRLDLGALVVPEGKPNEKGRIQIRGEARFQFSPPGP